MDIARRRMGVLQIGIIVLALATALIHLVLWTREPGFLFMFLLNAIGYTALVIAYYFPPIAFLKNNRRLVRYAFIAYTLVTIVGWVVMGERSAIGYIDKAIEAVLVVLLFLERP